MTLLYSIQSFSMLKWCTSLILTIVLAGSAFAGVPMHSGERHCPMMGTDECCEKAESQNPSPQVYTARLCCSLNCSVPGTTGPTGATLKAPSITAALHSAINIPAAYLMAVRRLFANLAPDRNQHSPPFYIQHLALLI
jgi:hypothetical protein